MTVRIPSQAWRWQKEMVEEACRDADVPDRLLILQHPPSYTLGAGSTEAHIKFDLSNPPHPLYRTERGGEVTYHGPGQLVVYPILNLNRHQTDLHWYLRQLEEVAIVALDRVSGGCFGHGQAPERCSVEAHPVDNLLCEPVRCICTFKV